MEKAKSAALALLVALSLVQSYFLMYGLPSLGAESVGEGYYLSAEVPGTRKSVEQLVFPERIILHLGGHRHTVFYPDHLFYDLIYEKLKGRVFRGFQRVTAASVNWAQVRAEEAGVEVRFAQAVPFALLQRVFKLEGDFLFSRDAIEKIWIYAPEGRDDVRAFLFGSDGAIVYEALRVDMTAGDVRQFVGFGEYWPAYRYIDEDLYIPERPLTYPVWNVPYRKYLPEQLEGSLFFDPGATRMTYSSKDGSQILTDGKRGLKVEQSGTWLVYTDPMAVNGGIADPLEQLLAGVEFVNRHGGWDGVHLLVPSPESPEGETIRFQQYFRGLPVLPGWEGLKFGHMQLVVRQGEVAQYERPLIVMEDAGMEGEFLTTPGLAGSAGSDGPVPGVTDGPTAEEGTPVSKEIGSENDLDNPGGIESGADGEGGTDGGRSDDGRPETGGAPEGNAPVGQGPSEGEPVAGETTVAADGALAEEAGAAENTSGEAGGGLTPAEAGPAAPAGPAAGEGSVRFGSTIDLSYGDALLRELRLKAEGKKIKALLPAYRALLYDDHIRLVPVWAIRLANGEWRVTDG